MPDTPRSAILPATVVLPRAALPAARGGVFAPPAEADPGRAATDTLDAAGPLAATPRPPSRPGRRSVVLATLAEVEDLLDYLEARGIGGRQVAAAPGGGFEVRWK